MRLRYGSRRSSLKNTRTTQNDTKTSTAGRKKAKEIFFSPLHNDLSKSRVRRERRGFIVDKFPYDTKNRQR
tara:strand:- start:374 stop:586 length:213 start_codon:yes stop_codon:yes gene_type:complete